MNRNAARDIREGIHLADQYGHLPTILTDTWPALLWTAYKRRLRDNAYRNARRRAAELRVVEQKEKP